MRLGRILKQARSCQNSGTGREGRKWGSGRKQTLMSPGCSIQQPFKEETREMGTHHTPSAHLPRCRAEGRENLLAEAETAPGTWVPRSPGNTLGSIMTFQTQHDPYQHSPHLATLVSSVVLSHRKWPIH